MEAKCMQEEKINQIFQKLEEIEVRRSKAFEEMIVAIRATTAIIKGASSPTPMAPPPPAPTNSTWELGDRKDMDQAPYIVTKDLPKVTPTKCSTLCSSSDIKPDLIVDVPVENFSSRTVTDIKLDTPMLNTKYRNE
uniref:Uncharacterized protein n=2 Tax=Oryza TaxID=4527 RepID=A0A0E0QAP1_ORYRU